MGAQYAANWYADPTGRHELRYHDGTGWTEHVSDNGQHSIDPVEATAPVAIRAKLGRPAAATTVQGVSSDADELAKWAGAPRLWRHLSRGLRGEEASASRALSVE